MTIEQLNAIKAKHEDLIKVRKLIGEAGADLEKHTGYRKQVLVCGGTGCTSSRSQEVIDHLEKSLAEHGIRDVLIIQTGCFGLCALGPIMIV